MHTYLVLRMEVITILLNLMKDLLPIFGEEAYAQGLNEAFSRCVELCCIDRDCTPPTVENYEAGLHLTNC